ncbi:hypothetical protein [Bradyrhizobium sp. HKCCYLS20291]
MTFAIGFVAGVAATLLTAVALMAFMLLAPLWEQRSFAKRFDDHCRNA